MADTPTEVGFSYEYGTDINVGTEEVPAWQPVRFAKSIAPTSTPKEVDGATYDDEGADHPIKTGESWEHQIQVQQHRLADGKYLPEVEKLLAACGPDATGTEADVRIRWYDKPADGKPANPTDAYEGIGTVSMTRATTGVNEEGGWSFTVKGKGPRKRIPNPMGAGKKPVIASILPAGKKVNEQITITGTGFTGATKVTFGNTQATGITVQGDGVIVATIPTGASGSANVTVTAPGGVSAATAYSITA